MTTQLEQYFLKSIGIVDRRISLSGHFIRGLNLTYMKSKMCGLEQTCGLQTYMQAKSCPGRLNLSPINVIRNFFIAPRQVTFYKVRNPVQQRSYTSSNLLAYNSSAKSTVKISTFFCNSSLDGSPLLCSMTSSVCSLSNDSPSQLFPQPFSFQQLQQMLCHVWRCQHYCSCCGPISEREPSLDSLYHKVVMVFNSRKLVRAYSKIRVTACLYIVQPLATIFTAYHSTPQYVHLDYQNSRRVITMT